MKATSLLLVFRLNIWGKFAVRRFGWQRMSARTSRDTTCTHGGKFRRAQEQRVHFLALRHIFLKLHQTLLHLSNVATIGLTHGGQVQALFFKSHDRTLGAHLIT